MKNSRSYKSIGIFSTEEVIEYIKSPEEKIVINGISVNISGSRLKNFAVNGIDCVCCGAKGEYFSLEAATNDIIAGKKIPYHFNLYALNSNGKPVMMTRDHIILKSLGGKDEVSNYNPMCLRCNQVRGNRYEDVNQFIEDFNNNKITSRKEKNSKKLSQADRKLRNIITCAAHVIARTKFIERTNAERKKANRQKELNKL